MFWLLVCLTAAGAFGAGLVWAQGRPRIDSPPDPLPLPPPPEPPPPRTGDVLEELFALSAGDVVIHLGSDHCVERVARLANPEHVIVRAHLDGNPGASLMVLDVPRPWAAICNPARQHLLRPALPETVEHQGFRYLRLRRLEVRERVGHGEDTVTRQLHIYEGPDGLSLFILNTADNLEVLEGRTVRTAACQVLPGSRP